MLVEPNCSKRRCKHFEGVKYLDGENENAEVARKDIVSIFEELRKPPE